MRGETWGRGRPETWEGDGGLEGDMEAWRDLDLPGGRSERPEGKFRSSEEDLEIGEGDLGVRRLGRLRPEERSVRKAERKT